MVEPLRYDDEKALLLMDGAATVNRILRTAPPERLAERRFGDWNALELVAHLVDVAELFADRVRLAIEEDTPYLRSRPRGSMVDERDPIELAKRLLRAHQRIVAYLRTPGAAARPAVHSEWGPVDAGHIAAYQADHTRDHVAELAPLFPPAA